ncbi:hypothetical protein EV361DRAFT_917446 [Lentinula raphanica]|nr:hypothetical protein EV361DRAFT_917446 [Lentinula raphanica]
MIIVEQSLILFNALLLPVYSSFSLNAFIGCRDNPNLYRIVFIRIVQGACIIRSHLDDNSFSLSVLHNCQEIPTPASLVNCVESLIHRTNHHSFLLHCRRQVSFIAASTLYILTL